MSALFTAIAAGVGLASTVAGTGMSFYQAIQQSRIKKEAEAAAEKAMADARKKLEVNYYDNLAIQKEAYELERQAALAAGAQAIQAAQEGERGIAGAAGRIEAVQNASQRDIAMRMGKEMIDLDKLSAVEDANIAKTLANIDVAEATGAQQAARDAETIRNSYLTKGFEGVQSIGQQTMDLVPLYSKTKSLREANTLLGALETQGIAIEGKDIAEYFGAETGILDYAKLSSLKGRDQVQMYLEGLNPDQLRSLGYILQDRVQRPE